MRESGDRYGANASACGLSGTDATAETPFHPRSLQGPGRGRGPAHRPGSGPGIQGIGRVGVTR